MFIKLTNSVLDLSLGIKSSLLFWMRWMLI